MEDLTNFFAEPRKAKEVNNKVETKSNPDLAQKPKVLEDEKINNTLEDQQNNLKEKLESKSQDTPIAEQVKKVRYKAIPKERKVYFEKRSDLYSYKRIQVNDDDYRFLSDFEKGISIARRHINAEDRANYRITSNTLIRIALEDFVSKAKQSLKSDTELFEKLQSEEAINDWVQSLSKNLLEDR